MVEPPKNIRVFPDLRAPGLCRPGCCPFAPLHVLNLPLLALAIAAFGIGTTEFVILGLLPEVAGDLSVSIPAVGMLVSAYALGVAVGGPLLAVATAHWPRKTTLTG